MPEFVRLELFDQTGGILVAVLAVVLVGFSKGGFGGALGLFGVPLLALKISPIEAAAILFPLLLLMDGASVWMWRGKWSVELLKSLLPGAMLGLAVGWVFVSITSEALVRLIIGIVALIFVLQSRISLPRFRVPEGGGTLHRWFWTTLSGFTSFISHAGGPPFHICILSLRLPLPTFLGTSVAYFALMNLFKIGPYLLLGVLDRQTLITSALLMPLALVATLLGVFVSKRVRPETFYPVFNCMLFVVGIKLVYDGWFGLL